MTEDSPTKRAEDSVAAIVELVGGLAHELRNPLSTLMVNLKLLAEELEDLSVRPEDARRRGLAKVGILRRETERLQQLFDEFLRLAGPCPLRRSANDLNTIVQRLMDFLDPVLKNARVEARVESTGPAVCMVDEMLLSQALLNIMLNAQQSMPEGGRLTIKIDGEGDQARIEVSDTGVGISAEDQERIFRPFFSTRPGGMGLGLPITKRIIEEHGGRLTFHSRPGQGTTFTITLPKGRGEMKNGG